MTLLAAGTGASPQLFLLGDDNRLPLGARAKPRLVNGVNGLAGNISPTADANPLAHNVAFGSASAASVIAAAGNVSELQAYAQGKVQLTPVYGLTLQSQGVYSVFILGSGAAPAQIVRAER